MSISKIKNCPVDYEWREGPCVVRSFDHSMIPGAVTKAHWHDFYEYFLLSRGNARLCFEGEFRHIMEGSLLLINPGEIHSWEFSGPCEGYILLFKKDWLEQNAALGREWFLTSLLSASKRLRLVQCVDSQMTRLRGILRDWWDAYNACDPYRDSVLGSCLRLLLIEMARGTVGTRECFQDPLCRRFLDLLETEYSKQHSTTRFAEQLQVSAYKLEKQVFEQTGKRPSQWIRDKIMEQARELLAQPEQTISEIAYELGFSSPSNFGRFFKHQTGKTPLAYRNDGIFAG
jgi:AraC family transcriptional activator of pobA